MPLQRAGAAGHMDANNWPNRGSGSQTRAASSSRASYTARLTPRRFRHATRTLEPHASELVRWMRDVRDPQLPRDRLLERVATRLRPWPADHANGTGSTIRELDEIRLEFTGFAYFLATVMRVFGVSREEDAAHFRAAQRPGEDDLCHIERLAMS